MKTERVLLVVAVAACILPCLSFLAIPTIPQDRKQNGTESERITTLSAELKIDPRGKTDVVEQITYNFADHTRQGITFSLPTQKNLGGYTPTPLTLSKVALSRNAHNEPITQQRAEDGLLIKTGQEQQSLTDEQTYTLSYTADTFIIKKFSGEEAFSFSIDPARFGVPIDTSSIIVQSPVAPKNIACSVQDKRGRDAGDCHINQQGTLIHTEATRWLEPNQHLSIEMLYPAGTFSNTLQEHSAPLVPVWLIVIILHTILAFGIWFFFGRDARGRGVIIPDEEFLKNIKPYEAGALAAQWPTYASFVGLLLGAAQRNIIRFERIEAGGYLQYEVKRIAGAQGLDPVEIRVLKRLFLYPTESDNSKEEMESASFDLQSTEGRLAYRLYEKIAGERLVQRGWYDISILSIFLYCSLILIGWTTFLFLFLTEHIQDPHLSWIFFQIPFLLPVVYALPRLTKAGALAREQVQGLARYISVAEKERLAFHKSLENYTMEENSLHAYAVALGLQKDWMKYYFKGYKEETLSKNNSVRKTP